MTSTGHLSISIINNHVIYLISCFFCFFYIAIAVDSYTDTIYWSSEGSSASVYSKRGSLQPQALYSNRDQPFALEYDWVGNRLLWVEDGVNVRLPNL